MNLMANLFPFFSFDQFNTSNASSINFLVNVYHVFHLLLPTHFYCMINYGPSKQTTVLY